MNDVNYVVKKSSDLTKKEVTDFINVINTVFSHKYDSEWFNWKYINNIYGDSIIVIAYDNNFPVGSRALWRNDLEGKLSYQPADTAVIGEYRGSGIFYEMTKRALALSDSAIIYNYPNNNSLHGYLKMGWKIIKEFNLRMFKKSDIIGIEKILEKDYIRWRFVKNPVKKYYYIGRYGKYYLLSKRKYNIYYVLAELDKVDTVYLRKPFIPVLLYYTTKKGKFSFLNTKSRIVSRNSIDLNNLYKSDAI